MGKASDDEPKSNSESEGSEEMVEVERKPKKAAPVSPKKHPPVKKHPPKHAPGAKKHAPQKHAPAPPPTEERPKVPQPPKIPTEEDDPEVYKRWQQLQSEFLEFSNFRLLPGGSVHKSAVVKSFRLHHPKYETADALPATEILLLLQDWYHRKLRMTVKDGTYEGVQLNPKYIDVVGGSPDVAVTPPVAPKKKKPEKVEKKEKVEKTEDSGEEKKKKQDSGSEGSDDDKKKKKEKKEKKEKKDKKEKKEKKDKGDGDKKEKKKKSKKKSEDAEE